MTAHREQSFKRCKSSSTMALEARQALIQSRQFLNMVCWWEAHLRHFLPSFRQSLKQHRQAPPVLHRFLVNADGN